MRKRFHLLIFAICMLFVFALAGCDSLFGGESASSSAQSSEETRYYWGTLVGTVTENGEGLEGVTVTSGDEVSTTDEGGRYEIKVYSNGATVSFEKAGCITQSKTFKSSSFYKDEIEYSFIMFISTKVEGTVVDGSGNAVENATVTIGIQEVTTATDGTFCFDEVIGTSMILTVEKDGKTARKPLYTDEMREGHVEVEIILE